MSRPLATTAALGAVALALAACGSSDTSGGDRSLDLTIGDIEAYTGDLGALGETHDRAVKLAARQANAAARRAGADLSVTVQTADTESDPQAAVSAARKVVNADASCLTGPVSTPEAQAVLNSVTRLRRIAMLPSATSTKLSTIDDDDSIFRTAPPDSLQSLALVAGVESRLGGARGKRVAIGYQNSPYGEGLAETFAKAWRAKGGTISGPVGYDPTQSGYDSEAGRLLAGDPDALVIADYPDTFGKVAAALLRTGRFHADRLFVSDALAVSPIPKGIPAQALEGAWGTRAGAPTGTPDAKAFDASYRRASGGKRASLDANSYDAGVLCFLAAVAAGSTRAEDITDALPKVASPPGRRLTSLQLADAIKALQAGEEIDYQGVSGAIDFDDNGDPTTGLYDLFRWQRGRIAVQRQLDARRGP